MKSPTWKSIRPRPTLLKSNMLTEWCTHQMLYSIQRNVLSQRTNFTSRKSCFSLCVGTQQRNADRYATEMEPSRSKIVIAKQKKMQPILLKNITRKRLLSTVNSIHSIFNNIELLFCLDFFLGGSITIVYIYKYINIGPIRR